jgi:hypothetical protein
MTTHHRPTWQNTRTDPDTYADGALDDLLSHVRIVSAKTQCYIRDSLSEAFACGEKQGETRALRLLLLARVRWADDPLAEAAIIEIVQLLAPDVGELLKPEGD